MKKTALAVFLLVIAGAVLAEDSVPALETAIVVEQGKRMLSVSGTAPDSADWLGVSFYKPTVENWIWDGDHAVYLIPGGPFSRFFAVPDGFGDGTYEVALWKSKLEEKTVYRLDTMRAYGTGETAQ